MSKVVQNNKPNFKINRYLQDGEYIADILTPDIIKDWKRGHKVLICANTGAGKTYFVLNTIYTMLKAKQRKMLFLTNRIALKEQLICKYGDQVEDVVHFMNYQSFKEYIKYNPEYIQGMFDMIVCDECHYFFNDASFAPDTDLSLNFIIDNTENELVLFLSATSQTLEDYFKSLSDDKQLNFQYRILKPYKFNECFYWDDFSVIRKLLYELPDGEKAIFFCKSIKRALELHNDFPYNSSFICATTNHKYGDRCEIEVLGQLKETERFEKQILFTTSIIENGINIYDPQLKHIIIDLYDFDTIIQCLGRRRIRENDILPNIYIRQIKQPTVTTMINNIERSLKPLQYFRTHNNEEFNKKYMHKKLYGLLYTESIEKDKNVSKYVINLVKEFKLRHDMDLAHEINEADTKFGHLKLFCGYVGLKFQDFNNLSTFFSAISLNDKLNYYLEKPLFGNEKTIFLQLLKKDVLHPLIGAYKVETINQYFHDVNLDYYVLQKKENKKSSEHYGKRYWVLKKKSETVIPQKTA